MVKLDVVSGFLGAGKTTLILKLLQVLQHEKIAIIENEYGNVNIDSDVVRVAGFDVYELTNGCVCCSLKEDFRLTLKTILNQKVDRIVFEPSGIFVLSEIFDLFKDEDIRSRCTLNSIITVVDATNFFPHVNSFANFYRNQIQLATYLLISKSQLIDPGEVQQIEENLRLLNPTVPIWNRPWDEFTSDDLLNFLNGGSVNGQVEIPVLPMGESHFFENFSLTTSKEFTGEELRSLLEACQEGIFGEIIRGKGVVPAKGGGLAFNYVSGQYDIQFTEDCSGNVIFIGRELKTQQIQKCFL